MARKTPRKSSAKKSANKALQKARKGKAAKVKGPQKRVVADKKAAAGATAPWTTAEIDEAFRRFQAANPQPRGELQSCLLYTSPSPRDRG